MLRLPPPHPPDRTVGPPYEAGVCFLPKKIVAAYRAWTRSVDLWIIPVPAVAPCGFKYVTMTATPEQEQRLLQALPRTHVLSGLNVPHISNAGTTNAYLIGSGIHLIHLPGNVLESFK